MRETEIAVAGSRREDGAQMIAETIAGSRRIRALLAVWACFCSGDAIAEPSTASPVCEREIARAALAQDVPLGILYSVGLTETGRRGVLSPFAINVDGSASYPSSATEAVRIVQEAQRSGASLIDVGCMQINLRYHARNFERLGQMFEPARNVGYAARFLKELRMREGNWTRAVARYHAGAGNHPAQKRYVCAVVQHLIEKGHGRWTDAAKTLCAVSEKFKYK